MYLRISIIFILITTSKHIIAQYRNTRSCRLSDGATGVCTQLKLCRSALSNLRSGINPEICQSYGYTQNTAVCCRTEPRISQKKCKEYQKILYENKFQATPLLPLDAMEDVDFQATEIKCSALLRGVGFIVGGRNAHPEEFPHMAAIGYGTNPSSLSYKCGGALISENYIVTAAHCIPSNGQPTYVLLGDIHLNKEASQDNRRSLFRISRIIVHPEYKRSKKYNDIALIQLQGRVKFSSAIRPVCLPQPILRLETQNSVTATGWGRLGLGEQSEVLQAVNLTRYTQSDCNSYYNNAFERRLRYPEGITRTQLCAGDKNGGKDTCQGDSGGPLVVADTKIPCQYYLMGVTSFGAVVCGYTPGVYTNVQSFLTWIEQTVWPNQH